MDAITRRIARRHESELGRVVEAFADRPDRGTVLGLVGAFALFSASTFIRPDPDPVIRLMPTVAFAVIFAVIIWVLSRERLVICERGLLIGACGVLMRPFVVRFDSIAPGTVVPVTRAQRRRRQLGRPPIMSSVRASWWTRNGVHLLGPDIGAARRHRRGDGAPRAADARWPWFVGTGRTSPERATSAIAAAAAAAGFVELAERTARAGVQSLTGDPADAQRQLPGSVPWQGGDGAR